MKPNDCPHTALRIEPEKYRCSQCGLEFDRAPVVVLIAAMRQMLAERRKPKGKARD